MFTIVTLPSATAIKAATRVLTRTPAKVLENEIERRVYRCSWKQEIHLKDPTDSTLLVAAESAEGNPATFDAEQIAADDLASQVKDVAVITLLARNLPTETNERVEACRAIAGVIMRSAEKIEADAEDAANYLHAIVRASGMPAPSDIDRLVEDTAKRLRQGRAVVGVPKMRATFGYKVTDMALEWLGVATREGNSSELNNCNRPAIQMNVRQLREMSNECLEVLASKNVPPTMFVRGSELVRLGKSPNGVAKLIRMDKLMLRGCLSDVADFVTITSSKDGLPKSTPTTPRIDVCEDILVRPTFPPGIPPIRGIVSSPIFAPDGTLETAPGYLPATQMFYDEVASSGRLALTLADPTIEAVHAAVAFLWTPFAGFPFEDLASRAHVYAALIEPHVRSLIARSPMYLIEASTRGTGKTLLAETIVAAFEPRATGALNFPRSEEEVSKTILSAALRGPSHILWDNLEGRIESAALCSAITSESGFSARILGRSENVELPLSCTWLATGNNASLHPDVTSRSVLIRLDAQMERPEERRGFSVADPASWMRKNRADVLDAVLLLIRYWISEGRPPYSGQARSRFPSWLTVIGGILECAGIPGLLTNVAALREGTDSEGTATRAFVELWEDRFKGERVGIRELLEIAFGGEDVAGRRHGGILTDVLVWIDMRNPSQKFGYWMRKQREKVYGDRKIKCHIGRNTEYWLEHVSSEDTLAPLNALQSPLCENRCSSATSRSASVTPHAPLSQILTGGEINELSLQENQSVNISESGDTSESLSEDDAILNWGLEEVK